MKCVDIGRNTEGEGGSLGTIADAEGRKLGERTGLDTLVVLAVNVVALGVRGGIDPAPRPSETRLSATAWGVWTATLKLKGIDGGPHKRWSMWLNSRQREEPYPGT